MPLTLIFWSPSKLIAFSRSALDAAEAVVSNSVEASKVTMRTDSIAFMSDSFVFVRENPCLPKRILIEPIITVHLCAARRRPRSYFTHVRCTIQDYQGAIFGTPA